MRQLTQWDSIQMLLISLRWLTDKVSPFVIIIFFTMSWPTFILEVSTLYIHHFLKTPTWKSISLWIEDALIKAIQFDSLGLGHKPKINHQTRDTLDGSHQNVTGIYTPNHNKASNWLVATLSISNLILCIGAGQYYLRFNSFIWSRIIHLKKKKNYSNFANKVSSTISNMRSIKSNIISWERKSQSTENWAEIHPDGRE